MFINVPVRSLVLLEALAAVGGVALKNDERQSMEAAKMEFIGRQPDGGINRVIIRKLNLG